MPAEVQEFVIFRPIAGYDYRCRVVWRCSSGTWVSPSGLPRMPLLTDTIYWPERRRISMDRLLRLWNDQQGQDIAEYAVMLAVILVIVVGTIRLIGSNANNVFSNVASSIQ
jgi:Flp pilus assembly pilin Flp